MTNRNCILTFLVMFYQETVWTMDISSSVLLCFEKLIGNDGGWCNSTIMLCNTGIAQNITIDVTYIKKLNDNTCEGVCDTKHKPVMSNDIHNLSEICLRMECNMTDFKIPSNPDGTGNHNGFVYVTYSCTDNTDNSTTNYTGTTTETTISTTKSSVTSTAIPTTKNNTIPADDSISSTGNSPLQDGTVQPLTGSGDPNTVVIVVPVVVPIIIVVVVVAVLMYRRGQCKLLLGKCTKRYAKHSPDTTVIHAMSSTANENLYCDLNRDVNVNSCEVHYCELDEIGKETGIE